MQAKFIRVVLVAAVSFCACFASVPSAWAGDPGGPVSCTNDVDCPTAACGGQVCQWAASHTCVAAGTDPQGTDGWCTVDADCKCHGEGANCANNHCTFTLPEEAGSVSVADSGVSSGPDSSVSPLPDAGPTGSTSSGGCAIGGSGRAEWPLAMACTAALAAYRRRRAVR